MSARNITSEKVDSSGFQSGGYKAPMSEGGGKTTPKSSILNANPKNSGSPKGKVGKATESKNTSAYKG